MTVTPEEQAQTLLDDYHRARNAILKLRASFEDAAALPVDQRRAVGELLDPVGKLLLGRAPDGPTRELIYSDFTELVAFATFARGAAGNVLERVSVLGNMHSDGAVEPAPERRPEPEVNQLLVGPPSRDGWSVPENYTSR